jgi:hypothetical protein
MDLDRFELQKELCCKNKHNISTCSGKLKHNQGSAKCMLTLILIKKVVKHRP